MAGSYHPRSTLLIWCACRAGSLKLIQEHVAPRCCLSTCRGRPVLQRENNIYGTVPPGFLKNFPNILGSGIALSSNDLEGSLPVDLVLPSKLLDLMLSGNRLSGSIPPIQIPSGMQRLDLSVR